MLAAEVVALEHQAANFLLRQRRFDARRRLEPEQLEQALHEQIDEPDDRRRDAQHRREHVTDQRRQAIGVRGAEHLRRDFGKDQQRERDGDRPERERHLAFAEQALGDDGGDRRGTRGDERVAEQDDAEQLVGLRQQANGELGAALALLGAVAQPIAIDRHHRGLGDREKRGEDEQDRERDQQRAKRDVVQTATRRYGIGSSIWRGRGAVKASFAVIELKPRRSSPGAACCRHRRAAAGRCRP